MTQRKNETREEYLERCRLVQYKRYHEDNNYRSNKNKSDKTWNSNYRLSAVYFIRNNITNDLYIGSSKNVRHRWRDHISKSTWDKYKNLKMYQDMNKYGINNFTFGIICLEEPNFLYKTEQEAIDLYKPTYNKNKAYV